MVTVLIATLVAISRFSKATVLPVKLTVKLAPPVPIRNVSVPLPPANTFASAAATAPLRIILSSPSPPLRLLTPVPTVMVSLPAPPVMVSLPAPPTTESWAVEPVKLSLRFPVMPLALNITPAALKVPSCNKPAIEEVTVKVLLRSMLALAIVML